MLKIYTLSKSKALLAPPISMLGRKVGAPVSYFQSFEKYIYSIELNLSVAVN